MSVIAMIFDCAAIVLKLVAVQLVAVQLVVLPLLAESEISH